MSVECGFGAAYDLVGVGVGPFNLALAALAEPLRGSDGLSALFLDERPGFSWHPGMMIDGARLQVPFLADLVSLTDPTSRYSVLNWLRETGRLYGFYFSENMFLERREYEAYCRWVAEQLSSCRFGAPVTQVDLIPESDELEVCFLAEDGSRSTVRTANVVLGVGTTPAVPTALRSLVGAVGMNVCHSADYLSLADTLRALPDVTVVGSGQSGAEVVLDLLRRGVRGQRVRWLTRSIAFEPMEYSKLGLEHFTPDYTRYFHSLDATTRGDLLSVQGRLHKAISAETIADLHAELHARSLSVNRNDLARNDIGVTLIPNVAVIAGTRDSVGDGSLILDCHQPSQRQDFRVRTAGLVLATGYRQREPVFGNRLSDRLPRDAKGRLDVQLDHRVPIQGSEAGLYVQNAELHSHGVGAPDLGLGAHRAAAIINSVVGREAYCLPERTAHTSFAPSVAAASDPGILLPDPGILPPGPDLPSPRRRSLTSPPTGIEEATDASIVVTHSQG